MSDRRCVRFFVSGLVQGVFFRASTREQAVRLGISGHAHNLRDGRVEVLACGTAEALDELERWLASGGPPGAQVTDLERRPTADKPTAGFTTG